MTAAGAAGRVVRMGDTVAFLGVGVMGEALLAGLLRTGYPAEDVVVAERVARRATEVAERHGVRLLGNAEAAATADTLVIAVKPGDVGALLDEIRDRVRPDVLVVCVAAGITTAAVEEHLPAGVAVVRVMPNTPALVNRGIAAISGGAACREEHLDRAEALLTPTGGVVRVPEHQQDAVTAVSGSGPAYVFYVAEAMIEAGVMLGLARPVATELTVQTLLGAATMLDETGTHPALLRERVTSPGGTTAAALRQLDAHAVRGAFLAALEAARDRSRGRLT